LWAVTFHFNGYYYDTYGRNTPEKALDEALAMISKLKKK
jgi:hypothetical protein